MVVKNKPVTYEARQCKIWESCLIQLNKASEVNNDVLKMNIYKIWYKRIHSKLLRKLSMQMNDFTDQILFLILMKYSYGTCD